MPGVDQGNSFSLSFEPLFDGGSKDGKGLKLGQSYEIGHAFFLKIKDIGKKKTISKAKKIDVFSSYIEGTLKEYIRQIADEDKVEELLEGAREAFGIQ